MTAGAQSGLLARCTDIDGCSRLPAKRGLTVLGLVRVMTSTTLRAHFRGSQFELCRAQMRPIR